MGLIQDSAEHKAIRETVVGIVAHYGAEYFIERGRTGGNIDELWKELGGAGLLGVHLPEEYGGGGGGMTDAVSWSRNLPPTECHCWSGSSRRRSVDASWAATAPRR